MTDAANPWKPINTAPKDGRFVLLASVDEEGSYGVRHGFYEKGTFDRQWYDIDGEAVEPQFWMPMPEPPPGAAD